MKIKRIELNGTRQLLVYADDVNMYIGWKHKYRKEKQRNSFRGEWDGRGM